MWFGWRNICKYIDGSSNSITFLKFFEESSSILLPSGKPAYIYGDHIIMVNAPIHRNRTGQALCEWFDDMGCVTIFLPTYSPEFNPAEMFGRSLSGNERLKSKQISINRIFYIQVLNIVH